MEVLPVLKGSQAIPIRGAKSCVSWRATSSPNGEFCPPIITPLRAVPVLATRFPVDGSILRRLCRLKKSRVETGRMAVRVRRLIETRIAYSQGQRQIVFHTVIVLAVKFPLVLANLSPKVCVVLREAGNISEKEIGPFLIECRIPIRIRVVERERSLIAAARILRFLIPVVLESKFECVLSVAYGNVIEPMVIVAKIPVRAKAKESFGII